MLFLQQYEDEGVDLALLNEVEILGEAFEPIFAEIERNGLIEKNFYVLNEAMIADSLQSSTNQWGTDVVKFLAVRQQIEGKKKGGGLVAGVGKVIRTLINYVFFGLALLLVLAVLVIALGHLLVKVWNAIVDTLKKLFDAIWKIVKVRREAEVRDKLLIVSQKLDGIADKVSRDKKKTEEIRTLRYEITRMISYIDEPGKMAAQPA